MSPQTTAGVEEKARVTATADRGVLTRVTLAGVKRRIDLLLPAEVPVGELFPDILEMLGELDARNGERPMLRRLVKSDSTVLALDETLASAGVADGAVLRLVREGETPAAPVVHDVADDVAEDADVRDWCWSERAKVWTAGASCLLLALTAAVCAVIWFEDRAGGLLLGAAVPVAGLGATLARYGKRAEVGTTLILLGGVTGLVGAFVLASGGAARLAALSGVVVVVLTLLSLVTSVGRGGLVGAGALAGAVAAWESALLWSDLRGAGVAVGVLSVLLLGYVPRLALSAAGLTRLDDRRSTGASVVKQSVDTALAATHRGLVIATVVAAASATVGGWLASADFTAWSIALTVLLALILASRARAYPLAAEVVTLQLAALVLVVRLVLLWAQEDTTGPLVALVVLALLPLAVLAVRPADHVRARLRRLANLLESICVVVLIPVALGVFGVYARLLDTF